MSLQGKFKQPLYKEDLMPVLKQGIFVAFIGGLLIGALNLLITYLAEASFVWILSFIMAYFLAKRIRNAYVQYHIWYSVIAVIGFIIGFYWSNVVSYAGLLFVFNVVEFQAYIDVLNPMPYFAFLAPWRWFGNLNIFLDYFLSFLFFLYSCFYAFNYSKRR